MPNGLLPTTAKDLELIKQIHHNRLDHFRIFLLELCTSELFSTSRTEICNEFFGGETWFGVTYQFDVSTYSRARKTIKNQGGEEFPVELLAFADYLTFVGEGGRQYFETIKSLFWDLKGCVRAKTISLHHCPLDLDSFASLTFGSHVQSLYLYKCQFFTEVENWFGTRLAPQKNLSWDCRDVFGLDSITINEGGGKIHPFMRKWAEAAGKNVFEQKDSEKKLLKGVARL